MCGPIDANGRVGAALIRKRPVPRLPPLPRDASDLTRTDLFGYSGQDSCVLMIRMSPFFAGHDRNAVFLTLEIRRTHDRVDTNIRRIDVARAEAEMSSFRGPAI
jgi:hypothetical protein